MLLDPEVESQRARAIDVLRACSHEFGLKGSGGSYGHHQVWARDSMIALLGGAVFIEQVFALPGMGQLAVSSASISDVPMGVAYAVMVGFAVVLAGVGIFLLDRGVGLRS